MSHNTTPQQPYPLTGDIQTNGILRNSRAARSTRKSPVNPTNLLKRHLPDTQPHESKRIQPLLAATHSPNTYSCASYANTSVVAGIARSKMPSNGAPVVPPPKKIDVIILKDSGEMATKIKKGRWSDSEDKMLYEAVHKHGQSNWELITKCVPGRTEVQCRNRWVFWKRWTFRNTIQSSPEVGANFLTFSLNPNSRTLEQETFTLEQTPAQSYPVVPYTSSEFPTSPIPFPQNKEASVAARKPETSTQNISASTSASFSTSDSRQVANFTHPLAVSQQPVQHLVRESNITNIKDCIQSADVDTDTETDTETETDMTSISVQRQASSTSSAVQRVTTFSLSRKPSDRLEIRHILN